MDQNEIPMPEVLAPERDIGGRYNQQPLDDSDMREQMLRAALVASCGYGQQLWHGLATLRGYLADAHPTDSAADDEWRRWSDAYAGATSLLAGPDGDSGYGAEQAEHLRQQHRPGRI